MHVGYERQGRAGLLVAGIAFIVPAVAITAACAWLYVRYGALPAVEPFLAGIKPAVIAIILAAVWRLGRTAFKGWRLAAVGLAVTAAVLLGVGEVMALLIGAALGTAWLRLTGIDSSQPPAAAMLPLAGQGGAAAAAAGAAAAVSLWELGLFFLKIGAVLYGSGYVLVAFLEGGLVADRGWLTEAQLLDAIAIGQVTPGPVLSTATFIGYVIAGAPGAAVATAGIFLPSFLFVLILNPVIPRLRGSAWTAAFLDAVNVAAVGLMAAVTIELGRAALTGWPAWAIAASAAVLAVRRVNAAWIVLGGAVAGAGLAA